MSNFWGCFFSCFQGQKKYSLFKKIQSREHLLIHLWHGSMVTLHFDQKIGPNYRIAHGMLHTSMPETDVLLRRLKKYFSVKSSGEVHWIIMYQKDAVCSPILTRNGLWNLDLKLARGEDLAERRNVTQWACQTFCTNMMLLWAKKWGQQVFNQSPMGETSE